MTLTASQLRRLSKANLVARILDLEETLAQQPGVRRSVNVLARHARDRVAGILLFLIDSAEFAFEAGKITRRAVNQITQHMGAWPDPSD